MRVLIHLHLVIDHLMVLEILLQGKMVGVFDGLVGAGFILLGLGFDAGLL